MALLLVGHRSGLVNQLVSQWCTDLLSQTLIPIEQSLKQALSIVVRHWNGKATSMAKRVPHSECPLLSMATIGALLCFVLFGASVLLVVQWPVNYAALISLLICVSFIHSVFS